MKTRTLFASRRRGSRAGYSLIETVMAAILAGILIAGWLGMLSDSSQSTESHRNRSVAMNLALSEAERIRAAGPETATQAIGSQRLNARGETSSTGEYLRIVSAVARCDGGNDPGDNSLDATPIASGCPTGIRPTVTYTIEVQFPEENTSTKVGRITYSLRMGSWARGGGTYVGTP